MSKTCIQCGKKLGFFQKSVDEIYCSMECSAAAQREIAQTEQKAAVARAEQERTVAVRAEKDAAQRADDQAKARRRASCPKCGHDWSVMAGSGTTSRGECKNCGFAASFVDITSCPSCNGDTLVIESGALARCPRCKYRQG